MEAIPLKEHYYDINSDLYMWDIIQKRTIILFIFNSNANLSTKFYLFEKIGKSSSYRKKENSPKYILSDSPYRGLPHTSLLVNWNTYLPNVILNTVNVQWIGAKIV